MISIVFSLPYIAVIERFAEHDFGEYYILYEEGVETFMLKWYRRN